MPWEVVGVGMFSINNYTLLSIVDYNSKFPIIKKADNITANDLDKVAKIVCEEFGLSKKMDVQTLHQMH